MSTARVSKLGIGRLDDDDAAGVLWAWARTRADVRSESLDRFSQMLHLQTRNITRGCHGSSAEAPVHLRSPRGVL